MLMKENENGSQDKLPCPWEKKPGDVEESSNNQGQGHGAILHDRDGWNVFRNEGHVQEYEPDSANQLRKLRSLVLRQTSRGLTVSKFRPLQSISSNTGHQHTTCRHQPHSLCWKLAWKGSRGGGVCSTWWVPQPDDHVYRCCLRVWATSPNSLRESFPYCNMHCISWLLTNKCENSGSF